MEKADLCIQVRGARVHNLCNLHFARRPRQLAVLTETARPGKTCLASEVETAPG